ncbi:MAG: penicillin-binding protein 2, partial [Muribaculaceae bacterium]|nr:penicillin-binding protein 2 [Muribaculaceae bacterium]
MKRLNENRRHIMLRYAFIILLILLFSVRIVNCLVNNTIIHADKWNEKAMKELLKVDLIIPERGNILANDGSILATNLRYYNLHIDYRASRFKADSLAKYADIIADSLARRFPSRNAKQWKSYLTDPLKMDPKKRPRFFPLAKGVSHADVQFVMSLPFFNMNNKLLTGLISKNYIVRANPYGNMAARSIGRVTRSANRAGVHGYSGLEMALDKDLYGKIGYFKRVPLTKDIVNWTDIPAVPGADIQTTIDINIQDIVENELNDMLEYCDAEWGVAAMMEVETGNIVAISNLEKDPNSSRYIEGMNRAVKRFEPGSVVKVLSMMIALEDGIVSDPNEVITTGSEYAYAGGPAIKDAHPVEQLTVNDVIEMSSNIGMTRIIARKYNDNPSAFYSRVKSTGFLDSMKTNIAGEWTPRFDSIPNNRGGRIAMSRMCYGYATEIPPLYTLALYNAIAAGGKFIRPRLVTKITKNGVDSIIPMSYMNDKQQICSAVTAAKLRKMLRNVVFGPHGTATRLRNKNVAIAGKTGTCYMIEENTRAYNKDRKRLTF